MIEKFKFWVQPVQPLTFDDSISYLEFLGKVCTKLNEVIASQNQVTDDVNNQLTEINKIATEVQNLAKELETAIDGLDATIDAKIKVVSDNLQSQFNTLSTSLQSQVQQGLDDISAVEADIDAYKSQITSRVNQIDEKVNNFTSTKPSNIAFLNRNRASYFGAGSRYGMRINASGVEESAIGYYLSSYIPAESQKTYAIYLPGSIDQPHTLYMAAFDGIGGYIGQKSIDPFSSTLQDTYVLNTNNFDGVASIKVWMNVGTEVDFATQTKIAVYDSDDLPKTSGGTPDYSLVSTRSYYKENASFISSKTTDQLQKRSKPVTSGDLLDMVYLGNLIDPLKVSTGAYKFDGSFDAVVDTLKTSDFIAISLHGDTGALKTPIYVTGVIGDSTHASLVCFNANKDVIGTYPWTMASPSIKYALRDYIPVETCYIRVTTLASSNAYVGYQSDMNVNYVKPYLNIPAEPYISPRMRNFFTDATDFSVTDTGKSLGVFNSEWDQRIKRNQFDDMYIGDYFTWATMPNMRMPITRIGNNTIELMVLMPISTNWTDESPSELIPYSESKWQTDTTYLDKLEEYLTQAGIFSYIAPTNSQYSILTSCIDLGDGVIEMDTSSTPKKSWHRLQYFLPTLSSMYEYKLQISDRSNIELFRAPSLTTFSALPNYSDTNGDVLGMATIFPTKISNGVYGTYITRGNNMYSLPYAEKPGTTVITREYVVIG